MNQRNAHTLSNSAGDDEFHNTSQCRPSKLNRRRFIQLSVAAGLLAAMPVPDVSSGQTALAAAPVDLLSPIGKKWMQLGGQSGIGSPISDVVTTPDGAAQYQVFESGTIIYSVDWGAMLVSPAIFTKWLSFNEQVDAGGRNLLNVVGFPTQDFVLSSDTETGYFERGMIIIQTVPELRDTADGTFGLVTYGAIYEHYWHVRGLLGLPISEEANAAGGGRYQRFQNGDIYWRGATGAFEVHGLIRKRWLDLGGAGSPLGYPLSDEEPVKKDGNEIGRSSRFEKGVIYFSGATGAWEVMGDIRKEYETKYGGPAAPTGFGFPVSGQGTTKSGGVFNNFQRGVLVFHSGGAYAGMHAFNKLQLYVQRLQGYGCDLAFCDDQDLYVYIRVTTSVGTSIDERRPTSGYYGESKDLNESFDLTPGSQVAQSNLVIDMTLEGWDEDNGPDDHLGTVHVSYTIDNLWGFFDSGPHSDSTSEGSFTATFSIRNPLPYDPLQFRQQMFWAFHNFSTPELTYDQFAATFTDVDTDESAWFHPFNKLYYEVAYKKVAKGGNCFGMSLESVFAQVQRSLYSEPIIRYLSDTHGDRPDPTNPVHQKVINEINIKHGYQLGAGCVDWFLGLFLTTQDHNPKQCFLDSRAAHNRGDYPVISLSNGYFEFKGHTVRPYRWDDSNPTKWVIYIADPNKPATGTMYRDDGDPFNRIEIDPINNTFIFRHTADDIWSGTSWKGGRMFYVPFRHLSKQPRTPFWEVLGLLAAGTWLLLGDAGQTKQVTDDTDRTFYEPDLSELPTRWDQIRRDANARVPNFTRVPFSEADDTGKVPLEMYYARGAGATYRHAIVAAPDVAPGTPYEWVMQSATLSARVSIPGTPDVADIIAVHKANTIDKAVSVTIPAEGSSKQISWTMAGPFKQRHITLTNLTLLPGQTITISLSNGGAHAVIENDGPATTADVQIQPDAGATPIVVGTVTIGAGTRTPVSVEPANSVYLPLLGS